MISNFIAIEGLDGAGKTELIAKIAERMKTAGKQIRLTREPGGSPCAEDIRTITKKSYIGLEKHPGTDLLLMYAARLDHIKNLIEPELKKGKIVITDRFELTSFAYQGGAEGMAVEVETLSNLFLKGFEPGLTIYLDVNPLTGMKRCNERTVGDARDAASLDYRYAARKAYLECVQVDDSIVFVDANRTPEEVLDDVWNILKNHFKIVEAEDAAEVV